MSKYNDILSNALSLVQNLSDFDNAAFVIRKFPVFSADHGDDTSKPLVCLSFLQERVAEQFFGGKFVDYEIVVTLYRPMGWTPADTTASEWQSDRREAIYAALFKGAPFPAMPSVLACQSYNPSAVFSIEGQERLFDTSQQSFTFRNVE